MVLRKNNSRSKHDSPMDRDWPSHTVRSRVSFIMEYHAICLIRRFDFVTRILSYEIRNAYGDASRMRKIDALQKYRYSIFY